MKQKLINLFTKYNLPKDEFIKLFNDTYEDYEGGYNFSIIREFLEKYLERIKEEECYSDKYCKENEVQFIDCSENDYQGQFRYYLLIKEYFIPFVGSYGSCSGCGPNYKLDDLLELFEKTICFDMDYFNYQREEILENIEKEKNNG